MANKPAVNTPEWWAIKGQKYIRANDDRDHPKEFRNAAEWCTGPVLELGPAFGAFSKYLPDYMSYMGVDCSDYFVQECRRRHPTRIFTRGSVLRLGEHWRNAFETVCAFQMLEHFEKPVMHEAVQRMVMVATKRLVVSVPRGGPTPTTRKGDGHLIGWADEEKFAAELERYGKVQTFEGEPHHICAVVNIQE